MADSINPMSVTTVKQNVFTETPLTNATAIWVENTGNSTVNFAEKATEPTTELGGEISPGEQVYFNVGSSGVWLWTNVENSIVAVQEA
jgi:hypothetical protein